VTAARERAEGKARDESRQSRNDRNEKKRTRSGPLVLTVLLF